MLHSMNAAQKCTEVIWKSIVQVTISAQLEELSVSWLLTVLTCSVGRIFERICRPPFQRNRCIWNYLVSRGSFSFSVRPQQPHTNPRYIVKLPHKSCSCCCCCCTVAALVVVSLLLLGAWFLKHVVACCCSISNIPLPFNHCKKAFLRTKSCPEKHHRLSKWCCFFNCCRPSEENHRKYWCFWSLGSQKRRYLRGFLPLVSNRFK